MSALESKSMSHFGGPASLDPAQTLRLIKAFMAITEETGRRSVIEFAERLAATCRTEDKLQS